MFQPFELFKNEYINRLVKMDKKYLVSQTYDKAFDHFEETKTNILLTDYDQLGLAQIHYSAVKHDKYASIVDLNNPKHKGKIVEMLHQDSAYCLYWAIVKSMDEVKKRMDIQYKNNIRRYIMKNTTWRIDASEVIKPSLQVIYGELFIMLKRGNQTLRVKFDDIEKA
ncbi:MAG: hypothetical protein ABI472_16310 [Ginsengibacter sp.]